MTKSDWRSFIALESVDSVRTSKIIGFYLGSCMMKPGPI
jgi:hypothetical protein